MISEVEDDFKETCGDVDAVECPHCGYPNDFTDLQIDQCLDEGRVELCCFCSKPMKISAVDYAVTVFVVKAKE